MSIRPVKRVSQSVPTMEGAGVKLRRAFGFGDTSDFDPFLMMDDFRGDRPEDYLAGFPWHPHRGIETITYVLAGEVDHGDSLGNRGKLGSGDVQWMTAGSGILHQEMPTGDAKGRMHGFQLWANLPAHLKMTKPRYQDVPATEIPEVIDDDGTRVRVICGEFWGKTGPVDGVAAEPRYLDVTVPAGKKKRLKVEDFRQAFAYIFEGSATFADSSEPFGVLREAEVDGEEVAGARQGRQPLAGRVRRGRRGRRPGGRRGRALPSRLRPTLTRADRLARADRHEHAGPDPSGAERFAQRRVHQELTEIGSSRAFRGSNRNRKHRFKSEAGSEPSFNLRVLDRESGRVRPAEPADMANSTITTQCCIAGGGPAGMMLGFLLARAGVHVVVLEKHADFFRDFRGDTVHPSTLELMFELGLIDEFLKLPHQKVETLTGQIGAEHLQDGRFSPSADALQIRRADAAMGLPQLPGSSKASATKRSTCACRPTRPT